MGSPTAFPDTCKQGAKSLVYWCDPIFMHLPPASSWSHGSLWNYLPYSECSLQGCQIFVWYLYTYMAQVRLSVTFRSKKGGLSVTFNPIIRCSYNSKQVIARFGTMIYLWSDQLPQNDSKAEDVCPVIIQLMVYYLVRHATLISMVHI
jgi:hypothetical protein